LGHKFVITPTLGNFLEEVVEEFISKTNVNVGYIWINGATQLCHLFRRTQER